MEASSLGAYWDDGMKCIYGWVIRSKNKRYVWPGAKKQFLYFADRTGIGNKRYLTSCHYKVKWFDSKSDAEMYVINKARIIGPIKDIRISRRKFYLDEEGNYDYFKNRSALLR